MQRISSAKGKVIPFPKPKTEAERLAQEEQKRRNDAIRRLVRAADELDW